MNKKCLKKNFKANQSDQVPVLVELEFDFQDPVGKVWRTDMAFEFAAFEPGPGSTGTIRVPVADNFFELTILKEAFSTSEEISQLFFWKR